MPEDTPILCCAGFPQSGGTRARGRENGIFLGERHVPRPRIYQKLSIPLSLKEIGMRWETLNRVIPNLYSFLLESAALVWPADQI
ncbi:hypothetical protein EVAR_91120_1 [Eumeta japonica]|uniref:Uncharacterized protein n=1 Tax=Eumeta variegata TaxID=151549 RepID=A0A4C1SDG1_EUMVA|nr:hypothetical protein EVAR_91120_1 [Eumeta japonica]